MPAESPADVLDVSMHHPAPLGVSHGQPSRPKRKHRGGYNPDSHDKHEGVSIIRRRGDFWIKWRTNPGERKAYRYKWQRLPDTIETREQARKLAKRKSNELAAMMLLTRNRRRGTKHLLPVSAGIDAYLDALEAERRGRGDAFTRRARRGAAGYLAKFTAWCVQVGVRRCEELDDDHLREFRAFMAKGGLANPSVNRVLDSARAALNYMADEKFVVMDTREIGKCLKHYPVRQSKTRILNTSEIKRLIEAAAEHDGKRWKAGRHDKNAYHQGRRDTGKPRFRPLAPFVALALLTGARPGEIERITAADVHLDHGYILLREEKNNRDRTVPMHDSPLLRELVTALRLRAGGGLLVGRVKLPHLTDLGEASGIDGMNRKVLRATCVAHVASGSTESEYLLASRFGHGLEVSIRHYRQALHGIRERGASVEAWLGVEAELRDVLVNLGYLQPAPAGDVIPARA